MADVEEIITGYILSESQDSAWQAFNKSQYDEFITNGLYDPETHELYAFAPWMIDGDPANGPFEIDPSNPGFDFGYNSSHEGEGW